MGVMKRVRHIIEAIIKFVIFINYAINSSIINQIKLTSNNINNLIYVSLNFYIFILILI